MVRLCISNAGSVGLIPDQGTKIPTCRHAQPKQKNKTLRYKSMICGLNPSKPFHLSTPFQHWLALTSQA